MNIQDASPKQLRRAAQIKDQLSRLQNELKRLFGAVKIDKSRTRVAKRKRRKMSAAAKAKISRAAKARWAKVKAAKK